VYIKLIVEIVKLKIINKKKNTNRKRHCSNVLVTALCVAIEMNLCQLYDDKCIRIFCLCVYCIVSINEQ